MATNDAEIEQMVTTTLHHNSELLTMDNELHKFTKLINFFVISAVYWVSYSCVFLYTLFTQGTEFLFSSCYFAVVLIFFTHYFCWLHHIA